MRILFLDDMTSRHKGAQRAFIGHTLVQAFTAAEAIAALDGPRFDLVCLDHDLAEDHYREAAGYGEPKTYEGTGTEVALHIANMPPERQPERVVLHTLNDAGARRMAGILRDNGVRRVVRIPFTATDWVRGTIA